MEFHELFDENREVPEFQSLLQRMKVMDENGESQMDEDQWEAASEFSFTIHHLTQPTHVPFRRHLSCFRFRKTNDIVISLSTLLSYLVQILFGLSGLYSPSS